MPEPPTSPPNLHSDAERADEIRRQMLTARPAPSPARLAAGRKRGATGILVSLGLLAIKGKFLLTFLSAAATVWAYSYMAGLTYAVGITLLIFAHELGHVWAMRSRGLPVQGMLFVPFFGAFVTGRRGRTLGEEAFIAIMGPVWGGAAGLLCLLPYAVTQKRIFLTLLVLNQIINLGNLIPVPPLDGSRIIPLFAPKYLVSNAALVLAASTDAERALYRRAFYALCAFLAVTAALGFALPIRP